MQLLGPWASLQAATGQRAKAYVVEECGINETESGKQADEKERADGECVERTRWWVILPQRTLLSGASSGNMCGNTQMDSNSSCCEKQGCV